MGSTPVGTASYIPTLKVGFLLPLRAIFTDFWTLFRLWKYVVLEKATKSEFLEIPELPNAPVVS